jgi:hypothetical protein
MATPQVVQSDTTSDTIPRHGGFGHLAFFYRDQRDYLTQLIAFVDAGLALGEPVFIAVPAPKTTC